MTHEDDCIRTSRLERSHTMLVGSALATIDSVCAMSNISSAWSSDGVELSLSMLFNESSAQGVTVVGGGEEVATKEHDLSA